jgi:hypothetical protein
MFQADGNVPTKEWLLFPLSTLKPSVSRILKRNVCAAFSHDN